MTMQIDAPFGGNSHLIRVFLRTQQDGSAKIDRRLGNHSLRVWQSDHLIVIGWYSYFIGGVSAAVDRQRIGSRDLRKARKPLRNVPISVFDTERLFGAKCVIEHCVNDHRQAQPMAQLVLAVECFCFVLSLL
jgi:hypothetical protein